MSDNEFQPTKMAPLSTNHRLLETCAKDFFEWENAAVGPACRAGLRDLSRPWLHVVCQCQPGLAVARRAGWPNGESPFRQKVASFQFPGV